MISALSRQLGIRTRPVSAEPDEANAAALECSICLELLCQPLALPCGHAYCRRCLAAAFRTERRCPLCRREAPDYLDPAAMAVDATLERVLRRTCTVEYAERLEEVMSAAARLVRLRLSNDMELISIIPRPTFRWTLCVSLERDPEGAAALPPDALLPNVVKTVRFGLPKSCKLLKSGDVDYGGVVPATQYFYVSEAPFEVTATSWMSFSVPIVVIWQDYLGQPPLRLDHELDFHAEGGCWSYAVDLGQVFVDTAQNFGVAAAVEAVPCEELDGAEPPISRPHSEGILVCEAPDISESSPQGHCGCGVSSWLPVASRFDNLSCFLAPLRRSS